MFSALLSAMRFINADVLGMPLVFAIMLSWKYSIKVRFFGPWASVHEEAIQPTINKRALVMVIS